MIGVRVKRIGPETAFLIIGQAISIAVGCQGAESSGLWCGATGLSRNRLLRGVAGSRLWSVFAGNPRRRVGQGEGHAIHFLGALAELSTAEYGKRSAVDLVASGGDLGTVECRERDAVDFLGAPSKLGAAEDGDCGAINFIARGWNLRTVERRECRAVDFLGALSKLGAAEYRTGDAVDLVSGGGKLKRIKRRKRCGLGVSVDPVVQRRAQGIERIRSRGDFEAIGI